MGSIQDRNKILEEVAGWSDASAATKAPKIPSNVTGNPPAKPVANMRANDAQKAADNSAKLMNEEAKRY
jgi:hypothetical protein